mmetsp:Transcript_72926/g.122844  ORF Transcript_72926/g.122844 Transcript_72926/m.122844 type:complete len:101 (-) Transcript_72926:47-349(-)
MRSPAALIYSSLLQGVPIDGTQPVLPGFLIRVHWNCWFNEASQHKAAKERAHLCTDLRTGGLHDSNVQRATTNVHGIHRHIFHSIEVGMFWKHGYIQNSR